MKTMNQAKIATELGFKKSFFHHILSGKRNLRYPAAKKLAKQIGCKPELFLDDGGGTPAKRLAAFTTYLNRKESHV